MGAAKLAIKTKYQPDNKDNDEDKDQSDHQSLADLLPDHFSTPTVSRSVCDLIDLKSVEEFPVLFLHFQITELFINEKGIVPGGQYAEVNNYNLIITIYQQMPCGIAVEEAYLVLCAIIPDICPGHLAHFRTGKACRKG
jgi:hypothetical protein